LAKISNPESFGRFPEKVLSAHSAREALERIPRLLLVRLRSLGDSILTLPLLQSLNLWRPDLKLDVLYALKAFESGADGIMVAG
jgi:hypothetical protein